MTSYSDQEHVIPALKAGAKAYQLKDAQPDDLVKTLREVYSGRYRLSADIVPHVLTHMVQDDQDKEKYYQLTPVKRCSSRNSQRKSNKEIAAALFISEKQ